MKLSKVLSRRLKQLREAAGLSQQDVAMRGDLSLSLVAKLEQGKKADPRASTLLALAQALKVKPGQLLDDLFPPVPAESKSATTTAEAAAPVAKTESAVGTDVVPGEDGSEGKPSKKRGKKKGKRRDKVNKEN